MLVCYGVILNAQALHTAKLLNRLGQKVLVDVVVEIFKGDLHLGRLPDVVGVDDEPRHRQIHRLRFFKLFEDANRAISRIFWVGDNAVRVVRVTVVADDFLLGNKMSLWTNTLSRFLIRIDRATSHSWEIENKIKSGYMTSTFLQG